MFWYVYDKNFRVSDKTNFKCAISLLLKYDKYFVQAENSCTKNVKPPRKMLNGKFFCVIDKYVDNECVISP